MDVMVYLADARSQEELRSLRFWLADEPDLRGRTQLVESAPAAGTLGPVADVISIVLDPDVVVALVSSVGAWLRYRTADVSCRFTASDGRTFEMSAKRVRGADLVAQQQIEREMVAALRSDADADADGAGTSGAAERADG